MIFEPGNNFKKKRAANTQSNQQETSMIFEPFPREYSSELLMFTLNTLLYGLNKTKRKLEVSYTNLHHRYKENFRLMSATLVIAGILGSLTLPATFYMSPLRSAETQNKLNQALDNLPENRSAFERQLNRVIIEQIINAKGLDLTTRHLLINSLESEALAFTMDYSEGSSDQGNEREMRIENTQISVRVSTEECEVQYGDRLTKPERMTRLAVIQFNPIIGREESIFDRIGGPAGNDSIVLRSLDDDTPMDIMYFQGAREFQAFLPEEGLMLPIDNFGIHSDEVVDAALDILDSNSCVATAELATRIANESTQYLSNSSRLID